jgi:hypothetical protein
MCIFVYSYLSQNATIRFTAHLSVLECYSIELRTMTCSVNKGKIKDVMS